MEATAAGGRAALAENVSLMYQSEQQPQVASKKGKKRKNAAAPVDSVSSSPDDLSQLVSRLISRVDSLAQSQDNLEQQLVVVKEAMQENVQQLVVVKEAMQENVQQLAQVKEENNQTRRAMWNIYGRMVLDQARIQILDLTSINSEDLKSSELLAAVEARLPKPFALDDAALDMIFKTQPVRQQGNTAAHEGPPKAFALPVLGSDLSNSERKTLAEVYKYVYGVEPALE